MKIFKRILILLSLLCLALIALTSGLYYFKPQKFEELRNIASQYFNNDKKKPILHIKEKIQRKKNEKANQKTKVLFYNSDVYDAICDLPLKDSLSYEPFKGCHSCPTYLNKSSQGTFDLKYVLFGSFSRKHKHEALVFMSGCHAPNSHKYTIILLEKQGNSWQRVDAFDSPGYTSKPVSLRNNEGENFIVGLVEKKDNTKTTQKIRINSFFHKDHKAYDLLKIYFDDLQNCHSRLQGAFYPPQNKNDRVLSFGIEVIQIDLDTKRKTCPKRNYSMAPGHYIFDYETSHSDTLRPLGDTRKKLTLFEESFRF